MGDRDPARGDPGRGGDRRAEMGRRGEDAVLAWYRVRGYELVDRNWRTRTGELDLVVGRAGTVVFCEVKTRTSSAFGSPLEAVTPAKVLRLRRLATAWLAQARPNAVEVRIDVAAVTWRPDGHHHIEVVEGIG